jgi:dTMP kinase
LENKSGLFITIEGIDGCGKSTQSEKLVQFLSQYQERRIVLTREPGGSLLGHKIRDLLLHQPSESQPTPMAEIYLYMADRMHHIETVIKPNLEQGAIVISDRFRDSTIAYQGHGRGINIGFLAYLNSPANLGVWPDLTFFIDIPESTFVQRFKKKRSLDFMEQSSMEFYRKVRDGFQELCHKDDGRFVRIDGDNTIGDVQADIQEVIKERLCK